MYPTGNPPACPPSSTSAGHGQRPFPPPNSHTRHPEPPAAARVYPLSVPKSAPTVPKSGLPGRDPLSGFRPVAHFSVQEGAFRYRGGFFRRDRSSLSVVLAGFGSLPPQPTGGTPGWMVRAKARLVKRGESAWPHGLHGEHPVHDILLRPAQTRFRAIVWLGEERLRNLRIVPVAHALRGVAKEKPFQAGKRSAVA